MTEDERTKQLKLAFAGALLRDKDILKAAIAIYPADNDLAKAIRISNEWPNDPYVVAEMDRLLKEKGPEGFLPTKAQVAAEFYKIGTDVMTRKQDRIKALDSYSAIMGFIQKPSTGESEGEQRLPTFVIKKYADA